MREQSLLLAIYIQWMKLKSIIYSMYNSPTVNKFDIFISIMPFRASKLWSNIEVILAIGLKNETKQIALVLATEYLFIDR